MPILLLGTLFLATAAAQQEERAIVPQFADGGGWKSRLVLVNRSLSLSSRPFINFYGQNGAPLAFSILNVGISIPQAKECRSSFCPLR